jgi:hypothetical protein
MMNDEEAASRAQRKWLRSPWFWIGVGLVAMVLVTAVGVVIEDRTPVTQGTSTEATDQLRRDAYTECKVAVLGYLKSPSSADFPWYEPSFVTDLRPTYNVNAYVDAENSFGASIRTPWSCSVSRLGTTWTVNSVNIE